MADKTRIVVLGGGYGGVQAAKVLERGLGMRRDVDITLIDKNSYHTLMTELHEVAGGRAEPESVQISFKKIFGGRNVTLAMDRIKTIDFETRRLVSDNALYEYDYLVIGAGGEPEFYGIPGIKEHSFTLWSFDDALKIRRHVEDSFRRASSEKDAAKRAELLTFVVAGAGFTGIELAGELKDQRRVLGRKYHVDEADVRIIVVEALDAIIPNMPKRLQAIAARYLTTRGVEIMLRSPIVGAQPGKVLLAGNKSIATQTFIWTCGIQGCEFAGNLALTKGRCANRQCRFATSQGSCGVKDCTFSPDRYVEGKWGRLLVNEYMQSVDYPNVYVVGDVAWYLEGKRIIPQIVENAVQTAETAAHNIVADVSGGQMHAFKSNYRGIMVSLGAFSGVANVMGISLTGIFAIAVKHMINIIHLLGVAGVNQVWEYVKHEFLDVKNERSFIGGLAAGKVRGYWTLLLRVWLGFMWVVESTNKMTQGWLDFSSGQSKTGWMFSKGVIQAGLKAPDATSAASAAAGAATVAAAAAPAAAAAVQATSAASAASTTAAAAAAAAPAATSGASAAAPAAGAAAAAAAHAAAVGPHDWLPVANTILDPNSGLVTWFRRTFMDGIFAYLPYTWFQVIIVFTELLIGLALFGGLLTWWAAVVSIGLCIIFTLSGMFAWNQLWFFFAAIVMMGGAGRAFGLDAWVVPFFKRWWNSTRLARRTHFYADEPTK
jgi:NADH:ubiquinone reductase (H+-translocating)